MRARRIARVAVLLYTWMQIVLFGGLLAETVLIYPNVFREIPASFDVALDFLQVTDPGAFFPPSGAATIVLGLITLGLIWEWRLVRYWLAASLVVFGLGNGLFSMLFAWPRNEIMFSEGIEVHSAHYLEHVAQEFMIGQGVRLVASLTAAILATTGFLAFCSSKEAARDAPILREGARSARGGMPSRALRRGSCPLGAYREARR